ncbi:MAG: FKBP-type peptidyl-prolyl cis-trans isomerase [Desulfuromonadales bacterium]
MTKRARKSDCVTVHYIGTLDNGRIFDQRDHQDPLSFVLGAGTVFPRLESAIIDMAVGDVKNIHLPAEEAYGLRRDENLITVPMDLFPAGRKLRIGQRLRIELAGETEKLMRVRNIGTTEVLLDGNHDLAGCDLTFALQLVAIDENHQ